MPMSKKNTSKKQKQNPKDFRNFFLYSIIILLSVSVVMQLVAGGKQFQAITLSTFFDNVENGTIKEVIIRSKDKVVSGTLEDGSKFETYYIDDASVLNALKNQNVKIEVNPKDSSMFMSVFLQLLVPLALFGFIWFIFRSAQGANNQAMSFGKTRAKPWEQEDKKNKVTFKDIAGADEAVEELKEIVDFLKSPKKFTELGAKIPKGALLMGPPGTGKTLLAKAVSGEAGVPFFNLSGSEFVEMFVGVGASRVRDLFAKAKKDAPAIIFVDEIDAVGRHRGAGLGGGHDEREQTLNQLLVEMDGFDGESTVIVIAATNRPDILDPALLRPGRFDRQITVDKPDISGRHEILKIHARKKKLAKGVDLEILAKQTPGFTGADLENLMNEGALLSARENKKTIGMTQLQESVERVMAGPERKSRVMSEKEKEIIAYHEVGHALVAAKLDDTDVVHKISILPRGRALGYTLQLPSEDKYLVSRKDMLNQIQILLGGRVAEQLIFDEITTGASNDIERATDIARNFVCLYGMNPKMGNRKYGQSPDQVFVGRQMSDHSKDYSEETAREIDEEIRKMIDVAYQNTEKLLKKSLVDLKKVSKVLLETETIDGNVFLDMIGMSVSKSEDEVDGDFSKELT